jgi:hypothetical protein
MSAAIWSLEVRRNPGMDADDAELAGFPWRVYAGPLPDVSDVRWLVNAFTTRELAERFVGRHSEYGPLTIEQHDADQESEATS